MKNSLIIASILSLAACGSKKPAATVEPVVAPLQAHEGLYSMEIGQTQDELVIEKGWTPCGLLGGEIDLTLTIDGNTPVMHVQDSDDNIIESGWERDESDGKTVMFAHTVWAFGDEDMFSTVSFLLADDGNGVAFGSAMLVITDELGECIDFAPLTGTFEAK